LSGAPAKYFRPAAFAGRAGAESKDLRLFGQRNGPGEPQIPRLGPRSPALPRDDNMNRFIAPYCVCCNLAISFWARFSSDSDHSTRPLRAQVFLTAAEQATSLAMLARRCRSTNGENCRPSYTKEVSSPKSTSTCPSSL